MGRKDEGFRPSLFTLGHLVSPAYVSAGRRVCSAVRCGGGTPLLEAHAFPSPEAAVSEGGGQGPAVWLLVSAPVTVTRIAAAWHATREDREASLRFGPRGGSPKGTLGMCLIIHRCSRLYLSAP